MRRRLRSPDVLRRVAAGTGVEEVAELARQVEELAEAVEENAALEVPLTALVADLERSLVEPLERRLRMLGLEVGDARPAGPAGVNRDIPPTSTDR
ncbi:hypothetical protein [Nocardioides sp. SYSU DS0663]|uniref:hypothetical protein n=1 Tax=Nocardioides sp. SYSU DS0663 TaxID=3416445 RepID=UPI003F4C5032